MEDEKLESKIIEEVEKGEFGTLQDLCKKVELCISNTTDYIYLKRVLAELIEAGKIKTPEKVRMLLKGNLKTN